MELLLDMRSSSSEVAALDKLFRVVMKPSMLLKMVIYHQVEVEL